MLAMLTAIAAPSKKGEKASPAKNRDADCGDFQAGANDPRADRRISG